MSAPRDADEIRDANTRYHDVAADHYDAKWGIDFGGASARCSPSCARRSAASPAAFGRSLEIGAGTGLLHAEPAAGGRDRRGDLQRHLARDARDAARPTRAASASRSRPRPPTPRAAVRGRELRPRARPRRPAPHPRPATRLRRVRPRARPGGTLVFAGEPSRYGDRLARVPKRLRRAARAAVAGARMRAGAAAERPQRPRPTTRTTRWSASSTSTPSPPASSRAGARRRLRGRARARRGAARELVRLDQPHARGDRRPRDVPWVWRQYAYRGYLVLQQLDRGCWRRGCRRRSSTT